MALKRIKQKGTTANEGWPVRFSVPQDKNQVKFDSRGKTTITKIPSVFTPVGGNTGKAPVYNFTGSATDVWVITASPSPEGGETTPSDDTSLAVTGGPI